MDELLEVDDEYEPLTRRQVGALAGAVVVLALIAGLVVVVVAGMGRADDSPVASASAHGTVAPLDLSTVPTDMAAHYRYAETHLTEYQQIPCWCGCQQFLSHRNLADCFVRADGQGYEAHAAGCGVCTAEAVIAEDTLEHGGSPAQVKATVDSQFGSTAITTPPLPT